MAAVIDKYAKLFHSILHKYINFFFLEKISHIFYNSIFIELYFPNILSKFLINLYEKNIIQAYKIFLKILKQKLLAKFFEKI